MKKHLVTEVKYKGFLRGGIQIIKDESILGLYKGQVRTNTDNQPTLPSTRLTASVMREASYSTLRYPAPQNYNEGKRYRV